VVVNCQNFRGLDQPLLETARLWTKAGRLSTMPSDVSWTGVVALCIGASISVYPLNITSDRFVACRGHLPQNYGQANERSISSSKPPLDKHDSIAGSMESLDSVDSSFRRNGAEEPKISAQPTGRHAQKLVGTTTNRKVACS
jgi:hypothetical protein